MLEKEFAGGAYIFREGEPSDVAYIIRSGTVEISKSHDAGALSLAVLRAGEVFGEMGVLDEAPRSASARALDAVRVLALSRPEFIDSILGQEEEGLKLLRAIFERLRGMNQALLSMVEPGVEADATTNGSEVRPAGTAIRICLTGLTGPAREALGENSLVFDRLPLRIGREPTTRDARLIAFNEVALATGEPSEISLNHLLIDVERGRIVARDRGSRSGLSVNGRRIGGDALRMVLPLAAGENEIVLGSDGSPYRFRFVVNHADGAGYPSSD